jgi:hypothetical protein
LDLEDIRRNKGKTLFCGDPVGLTEIGRVLLYPSILWEPLGKEGALLASSLMASVLEAPCSG